MKVTVSAKGSNKLIVRDSRDGEQVETAVADPRQMAQGTKIVDTDNPKVQRGIQQGSLEVVGTVEQSAKPTEESRWAHVYIVG
jgi:hypothetical protein